MYLSPGQGKNLPLLRRNRLKGDLIMCRAGGPRCNGGKAKSTTTTTAPAASTTATRTVPSREDADRLAADLPADRKGWDGSPLNERDRRFFALRESGYKGPIDQDGYPDTTSNSADTLRYMAKQRGETVDW
jgi:hypothetical protein